jgi:hypothetical protein
MKKTIATITMFTFLFLAFTNIYAQEEKVSQDISNFSKYLGAWHSDMNATMGKTKEVIDYTVVYSPVADGHGVYMEETAKSPSMGTYKCSNLIGYDPYAKKTHWYSVDNMGTAHDHTFKWVTPDHFTLTHNSLRNGKKYTENIDCSFKDENTCLLKYVETLDGKEVQRSEGTFVKTGK